MSAQTPHSYSFGPFVLIPERQLLLKDGSPVRIGGRALDLLVALVERPGDVVGKRHLLARAWPEVVVHESSLKVNISALRRVLGDAVTGAPLYVATVSGRGYRFVAPVLASESFGSLASRPDAAARGHNLPTGTTRIFGRVDAIESIRREVGVARLVSIVGPGGIGKTTVAVAVAERVVGAMKDGVWLVDLALLRDSAHMPNAIATVIGAATPAPGALGALCTYLRDREMLLVLDSCEHLIDAAAACAEQILGAAPSVRILATSREPLLLPGERVRRLSGLGAPPAGSSALTAEEALTFPAVQLFVDRASDRLESFALADDDAPAVAKLCRSLDGLALAIEFAATRIDAFGVHGLLKQLDHRFRLLVGRRAGPERHRTLTATLDWSYGLLTETEAAVLRSVCVFAGTFDAEGASAVSNLTPADVADVLVQLASKSLLASDVSQDSIGYRLLETTRAYCVEQLQASGEAEAVRRRHADHVCAVLERAAEDWPRRPAREWGDAYVRMLDDLRSALAWAGRDPANRLLLVRLTVAGTLLWNHFSLTEECRVHVSHAVLELDAAGLAGTGADMKLQLSLAGTTLFARGLTSMARAAMQRSFDIAVQIGDTDYQLRSLRMIGVYELFVGEHKAAVETLETFAAVAAAKDPASLLEGEAHRSLAEIYVGRLIAPKERLERLYEHQLPAIDDPRFVRFLYDRNVDVGNVLSNVQWLTGSPDAAMRMAEATVALAQRINHGLSLGNALAVAACPVFYWCGRYQEASRYVAMLEEQVNRHGIAMWRPTAAFFRAALACSQDDASTDGIEGMNRAVAEFTAINHMSRMPFILGVLASALAKRGRHVEGSTVIRTALDRARAQGDRWCVPELMRIRAAVQVCAGEVLEAENTLAESISLAKELGATSWRLRAANDLANLWCARSRTSDAQKMLLEIYNEFTEGFDTLDLTVARDILARPSSPAVTGREKSRIA